LPEGEVVKDVANSLDFFTTSECRDMLFHVHEYQMTLSEIADFIAENGIEFLGFTADASIVHQFQARFPQAEAMADLALWDAFETDNPGVFAGMYQFWVRKKA
jgi:hypothetical protein